MRRLLRALLNGAIGALFCQTLVTAVLVVGFTQRLMRRATVLAWHRAAGRSDEAFAEFATAEQATRGLAHTPGWLALPKPRASRRQLLGALWENARQGFAVAANTWVATLPGASLWLFAWYDGWNNSFTKGYEQAAVGPLAGLLGVALFIAAMLYVPMAQARQASTGRWRSFYDFGLVRELVRSRWWGCVRLAAFYALLSVPVTVLKTAPIAFDRFESWSGLTDAEVRETLEAYFFWAAFVVFGAFVYLRLLAVRLYAGALAEGVREGRVEVASLASSERDVMARLSLLHVLPPEERHVVVRAVRGFTRFALRGAALGAAALVWFAFVAQIFVSEFLNYHPLVGWLNQPLVQLPWFHYVPPGLG